MLFSYPDSPEAHINPRMILLDLDGTLADSLSVMRVAYRVFLKQFQRKPTDAEFDSLNGPPFLEVVRHLKFIHALQETEDILLSIYSDIIDRAYTDVKPADGALDLLKKAKEHCCTIGIVTSNTRKRTQTWLETVRLSHMIDFIVSGEEATNGKPHPAPYIMALKKASCDPNEIVAIEDSPQGAQSAVNAGLKTLVLGHGTAEYFWPKGVEPISSLSQAIERLFINESKCDVH